MSFCKKWRDPGQQVSETCEKGRRGSPSLLRLDSTGEVTSVSSIQSRNMCRGRRGCDEPLDRPNNVKFKSVVNNFTMASVLDTASSYLTTASSFIESFSPYNTSTNLVGSRTSHKPDISTDLVYEHNSMLRSNERPNNCEPFSMLDCSPTQRYSKTWRKDLLGAIQSTVFSKDPLISATMSKSDKYIPPPVKLRLLRESQWHGLHRDSNLTPYNTMLLQRSRQNNMKSQSSKNRNLDSTTAIKQSLEIKDPKSCTTIDRLCKAEVIPNKNISTKSTAGEKYDQSQISVENVLTNQRTTKLEPVESTSSTTDWFEYENESENIIPIDVHQQVLKKDCPKNDLNIPLFSTVTDKENQDKYQIIYKEHQEKCRILDKEHQEKWQKISPWKDSEDGKQVSADLVQIHCVSSQRLCTAFSKCKSKTEKPVSSKNSTSLEKVLDNSNSVCEEMKSKGRNNSLKKQQEQCKKTELFSVLYVRNCNGTKRRSSAQKRSRHKAQKNSATKCDITAHKTLRNGDAYHPNSSVAFILGLDHDSKERCFSFQIECDDDDLDWSSCDENDHSDDLEDCDEINFFSPLRNLVNFQVTCSVPTPTSPSFHRSTLDRINLEWELNVAVKEADHKKRSQSQKKVHFKEDKQLSTVHHMIAWSYAYQAARKGPWEEIARDRGRFQRRIADGEKVLKQILDSNHRKQVFEERFE